MQKLLIAICSGPLAGALTRELSSRFQVHSCSTGADAVRLIDQLRPDALIIDLRLPERSGLAVLEDCSHKPPAIVALTNFIDEDLVGRADAAGVSVLALIPCAAKHIAGLLERITEKTPSPEG